MKVTSRQSEVMNTQGHLLVTGGPGSGKTTISILKAAQIAEHDLRLGQKVLFLSFARATVSRVVEAIECEQNIAREQKSRIEVETYHSFFWRILKTHGYLIGLPRCLNILTPPGEAIALSAIRSAYVATSRLNKAEKQKKKEAEEAERLRLASEEGRICFDLFAPYVGDILCGSAKIRGLLATMYPVVILDEFQDTNKEQWRVVKALGSHTKLIALADPEQRIYDWIGADPERLDHFFDAFAPTKIDLGTDNHRSSGTDITLFGDDLLTGTFRQRTYKGIEFVTFDSHANGAMTALVTSTYAARARLTKTGQKDWSLAILVPTKKMTRLVSDAFNAPPAGMPRIHHVASIELEAAILAGEIIAFLMQPDVDGLHFESFINLLRDYFHGRRGSSVPTQNDLKEASTLEKAYREWLARKSAGREIRRNSILVALLTVYKQTRVLALTGDPGKDWQEMRTILERGSCIRLKEVAEDVRSVRLLGRGMQLRQDLSQDWRDNGVYLNALKITRTAFVQEHFSTNAKPETGVVVMNMHKAKGKQFDEVIIFEGWPRRIGGKIVANTDRIVRSNERGEINDQARQNFRVSVTRGKQRASIMTPKDDPCILLIAGKQP